MGLKQKNPILRFSLTLKCPFIKIAFLILFINLLVSTYLFAIDRTLSSSLKSKSELSLKFDRISLDQGLSQAKVGSIVQDSKGFLWFGTADGLNKYDGYSFTVYDHDPLDSTSLSDSRIQAIYEDKAGTIWIGTAGGGFNKFDRGTEKFTHYKHDPSNPTSLSNNHVLSIYEDRYGIFWLGTVGGGLNRFDRETGQFKHFKHDPGNPNSISHDRVFPICEDEFGYLWIGTNDGGLNRFDRETEKFEIFQFNADQPNSLSNNVINAMHKDKSGTLWIGTNNGLNQLVFVSPSEKLLGKKPGSNEIKFIHYNHDPDNPNSLSDSKIFSIFEDRSGTLWIGTGGGGLNKLVARSTSLKRLLQVGQNLNEIEKSIREDTEFLHYKNDPYDPLSLSDNRIRSIFEDRSGLLWIGTNAGGLNKLNPLKEKFVHYKNDPANLNSLNYNRVYSIYQDRLGILWIGTSGGGLNKYDREKNVFTHFIHSPSNKFSLSYDIVFSIYENKFNTLWIGTDEGLNQLDREKEVFMHYKNDPSNPRSLSHNSIRCIFEDKSGKLWFGTDGGLNKFNRKEKTFVNYRHDPENTNSLSNNNVRVIYEDSYGGFWIGTYGGGLNRFDRSTETFVHFKNDPANSTSLSHNSVLSIYEDTTGDRRILWIATQGGGLNKFNVEKEECKCYTMDDGLPNNVVYGILGDDHGNLWLSTNKGLSKFNPHSETFKNYNVNDGLQCNEFNTGAYFKSKAGEMFFGGINGFNAFYPDSIKDHPFIPPVVISTIKKFNKIIKRDVSKNQEIKLSYKDNYLTFEFVALDFTNPQKNLYQYKMSGVDDDWIDAGTRRIATYTNLDPGEYQFHVRGSSSAGNWNKKGVELKIVIKPPFWKTWWFIIIVAFSVLIIGLTSIRVRILSKIEKARILNELTAAHDTQMGLMPRRDPKIDDFNISGVCKPAEAVGGDFFDYVWIDEHKTKLGIAIVDVSEKAMKGAMNAVMTSGMVSREVACGESPHLFLQKINKAQYLKTESNVFTTMLYGVLDTDSKIFTISNAGHPQPILKRQGKIKYIKGEKNHFPLGIQEYVKYTEKKVKLQSGDILVCYTDGLPEAMNDNKELFDFNRIERTIENMSPSVSASEAIEILLDEVEKFSGNSDQHDDITIVVIRVL